MQEQTICPSLTWLNMSGDVTITWTAENRDQILALVQSKMDEGYSFFILQPRLIAALGDKKVKLTRASQLKKATAVVVPDSVAVAMLQRLDDASLQAAVKSGIAVLTPAPRQSSLDTTRRARTAQEVVQSQSVAVRPIVGG